MANGIIARDARKRLFTGFRGRCTLHSLAPIGKQELQYPMIYELQGG